MLIRLISVYVMLYVVNRLLEVLHALRFASPFVPENAERFTKIAVALALGEIAQYGLAILIGIATLIFDLDGDADLEIKLEVWFVVLVVLVFAAVFREGARMKQDQDLTI